MKIAIQANSLNKLKFASDTTLFIGNEFQERGNTLYFFTPQQLTYLNGSISAELSRTELEYIKNTYQVIEKSNSLITDCDILLIRQDPPYNMDYLTNCHILSLLEKTLQIFNRPSGIINLPEKLSALRFPMYCPESIISQNIEELRAFFQSKGAVIIKPLFGFGGHDIDIIRTAGEFTSKLPQFITTHTNIIMQEYLKNVSTDGDKRILLLNGRVLTYFRKLPIKNSIVTNLAAGGTAVTCELTKRELEIAESVGDLMLKHGILLAGLDVADEKLLEINVTSPTGLVTASKLYNKNYAADVVDEIEKLTL